MSSRHSSSTKHRSSKQKNMEADAEAILESVKRVLSQIDAMLEEVPDEWDAYLGRARSIISSLDRIHFFRYPNRLAEQQWIIQVLQDYAYHDADDGSIIEVAEWCQTSWLRILRDHPDDVDILTGKHPQNSKAKLVWQLFHTILFGILLFSIAVVVNSRRS
jgi:hypothetical protein